MQSINSPMQHAEENKLDIVAAVSGRRWRKKQFWRGKIGAVVDSTFPVAPNRERRRRRPNRERRRRMRASRTILLQPAISLWKLEHTSMPSPRETTTLLC